MKYLKFTVQDIFDCLNNSDFAIFNNIQIIYCTLPLQFVIEENSLKSQISHQGDREENGRNATTNIGDVS